MKLNIAERIGMLAVFMVVITAIVVGGMFYQRTRNLLIGSALDELSAEVALAGLRMQEHIEALREDTRLLSEVPPIQGLLRSDRTAVSTCRAGPRPSSGNSGCRPFSP